MKYLLPLILLAGCTVPPTQSDIDAAASKQLRDRERCEHVADHLGLKSEVYREDDSIHCLIKFKRKAGGPGYFFSADELQAVNRYFAIQKEIQDTPKDSE